MPTISLLRTCRSMRESSGRENREKFYCSSEVTIKLLPVLCKRERRREVSGPERSGRKIFLFSVKEKEGGRSVDPERFGRDREFTEILFWGGMTQGGK